MTFDESLHPRGQAANAGQFQTKTNTAPDGTLAATGTATATLLQERATAATLHLAARDAYLRANKAAAIATLREQFPDARLVIFTRGWDEDQVKLHQVLGETDYDLTEGAAAFAPEQLVACRDAEGWIREMGDEAITYLDEGDEHEDWYEYQLDLTEQAPATSPVQRILDRVGAEGRSQLDAALSERDGRMISTVDTDEIAYQLEHGVVGEATPDTTERLAAQFRSSGSAARKIAETRAWGALREEVDDYIRGRLFDTISAAADELNPETL